MGKILLLVGTGGFFGSIARYLTALFFNKHFPNSFPVGIFAVNVLGCLIAGIIFGLSERYNMPNPEWKIFFITGFCGGFTTFSAFAYDNILLLQQAKYFTFAIYGIGSFAVGLIAMVGGMAVSKV